MSAHRRPASLRLRTARIAVAGAAGLASVLTIAPAAMADDAPGDPTVPGDTSQTPAPTEDPGTPSTEDTPPPGEVTPGPTDDVTPPTEAPQTSVPDAGAREGKASSKPEAAQQDVEPHFGTQKFRVGVKVADGSWVPEGTTTAGTTFTITETGPGVEDGSHTFTCTTDASTLGTDTSSTATFCLAPQPAASRAMAGVEVDPDENSFAFDQFFSVAAGDTVTIRQQTAATNLIGSTEVATIEPCETSNLVSCDGNGAFGTQQTKVLFANPGLPPIAKDDKRTTDEGQAIDIKVLSNDDSVNGAPVTDLDVVSGPGHGKAKVKGHLITYTPDDGFSGKDTFDYTYATPNGTATATVTVTIVPAAVSEDAVLPDTGGGDPRVLGLGLLLTLTGGWLTARGRRPRAHATVD